MRSKDARIVKVKDFPTRKVNPTNVRVTVEGVFYRDTDKKGKSKYSIGFTFDCESGLTKAELLACVKAQIVEYFMAYYNYRKSDLARRIQKLQIIEIEGI